MLTGSANGSIKVAKTSIRTINNAPVGDIFGQVILHLSPTPRICIEIDRVQLPSDFNESAGTFDILLDSGATLNVRPDRVRFERTKDKLFCKGCFTLVGGPVTPIQLDDELTEVQFGLLNFPAFLGEEYQPPTTIEEFKKGYHRRDFIKLQASSWVIEVRSLKNTPEIIERLRTEGGYGLTHGGSIRHADGKSFSADDVITLLKLLRLFFSFARGANCGLALVVGINDKGKRVWETWSTGRPSPWSGYRSWFDHKHGMTLTELFPGFYSQLSNALEHHPLIMAIHWYLLSNETQTFEGSIVLTQAALERLSQELVQAKGSRKEGVWIADALKEARIPKEIPPQLRKLREFTKIKGFDHGPHTLVKIRNELVHSQMELETLQTDIYAQARELGLWYVELMLLNRFGYAGQYGNRLAQEWRGQVECVPWV